MSKIEYPNKCTDKILKPELKIVNCRKINFYVDTVIYLHYFACEFYSDDTFLFRLYIL